MLNGTQSLFDPCKVEEILVDLVLFSFLFFLVLSSAPVSRSINLPTKKNKNIYGSLKIWNCFNLEYTAEIQKKMLSTSTLCPSNPTEEAKLKPTSKI